MSTVFVNVAIPQPPAPDGFEHIREFRPPKDGEWLQECDGMAYQASYDWSDKPQNYRWILRKLPPAPSPRAVFERVYGRRFFVNTMPDGHEAVMENDEPKIAPWISVGDIYLGTDGLAIEAIFAMRGPRLLLRKRPAPKEPTLTDLVSEHERNLRSASDDYDEHGAICKILKAIARELEAR